MESVTDNVFIEDEYDEEELVDTGDEGEVLAPSSGSTGLLLACLVAAAVLLVMLQFWLRRPRRRTAILLVGPPDGGKTSILLRLRDGSLHKGTVASMEPNEAEVSLQSDKGAFRPVRIIDVPGHPRLRGRFDALAPEAAGVVFVVDAADFMSKKAETAEQLYDVLSHSALAAARTPVLLACHKADLGIKAHSVDFLKKRLEKELDMMRQTRVALGGGGGREATAGLGPSGEPFSFNALARVRGPRVTAAATSAADAGGLVEIEAFIRACAAW